MRVAVVGAGMAGLGAARTLHAAGIECTIFEQSSDLGGRVATRRIDGFAFDHGATIISPRGSPLEHVMREDIPTEDLMLIEKPIYLHVDGRVTPVDPEHSVQRYTYRNGIDTLAELLAEGIAVRRNVRVEKLAEDGAHYVVQEDRFSHVVLTPPLPQTIELLKTVGDRRAFAGSQYRKTISVMFGIDQEVERPYHALLDPNQSRPLTWVSIESVKVPGHVRAPEGHAAIVAQMSARYSRYSFDRPDEDIYAETWLDVQRALALVDAKVVVKSIKRWEYSHAANTVSFESAHRRGERLVVAGDGFSGARTQQAYESGIHAASFILGET